MGIVPVMSLLSNRLKKLIKKLNSFYSVVIDFRRPRSLGIGPLSRLSES